LAGQAGVSGQNIGHYIRRKIYPYLKESMPEHIKAARNALLNYIHETGKADF
jgi:hypothetical protein